MSDDEEQAVTLGDGEPVEGAPLSRVSARLMWGIERSTVLEREGDTVVRTPDGPRTLADVLAAVDVPYFATQREFETTVREAVGSGPVPTATDESADDAESDGSDDGEADGSKSAPDDDADGSEPSTSDDDSNGSEFESGGSEADSSDGSETESDDDSGN
jgi:hypothetical protein